MQASLKVTAVVAATVAVAAAPSPSWSRPSATIALVGQETVSAMLDHGSPGPTVGDHFVTAQRLLRAGRPAGRAGGSCQIVAPAAGHNRFAFRCVLTLRLAAGQIALDGLATFGEQGPQPMKMAITGGTGRYRTARGEATVEERAGGEIRYRLSIR